MNLKNKYDDIKDYYNTVKEACYLIDNAELLGLYIPLTENWHWTYLLNVDELETWQKVEETIEKKYLVFRDQITQKINRVYVERIRTPKPKNNNPMKYLEIELSVWDGIDKGIQRYFNSISEIFRENENCWLLGQYAPASERYNWAHFFMYKSMRDLTEMDIISGRAVGRPENVLFTVERLFKLYEKI
ncbi:hypothetical protein GF319_07680 [Candidatus Bathyarchaeota archaeon]|nr:hypothetical protein [Candidatus Bathyarchaeota archaeon]